jgi:hypothetical protein
LFYLLHHILLLHLLQALQDIGLQPQLEFPVAVTIAAYAEAIAAASSAYTANTKSGGSSSSGGTAGDQSSSLMVDIACSAPARLLHAFQQHGLVQTLQKMPNSSSSGNAEGHAAAEETDNCHDTEDDKQNVLLAIEVDGPSHVAVNCWGYRLGSTVCRSWLLQQQGWEVLEVPWWQWEAAGL